MTRGGQSSAADAAARVVMLFGQTFDIDDYVYTALQAGANGFLLKDVPRRDDLSNAEIAPEFVVSEHTVTTHVGNVLSKLRLRDRIHAVVYAYETGFVQAGGQQ